MDEMGATTRTSRPEIIAHRAWARVRPENTLAGLQACLEQGIIWAEVDVRRTRDGQHVLFHDETLERMTGAAGRVADCTYEDLRALRVRDETRTAARIPLLREALDLVRGRARLYLDCCDVECEQLVAELRAAEMDGDVLVCAYGAMAETMRAASSRVRLVVEGRTWDAAAEQHFEKFAPVAMEVRGDALAEELAKGAAGARVPWIGLALGAADCANVWRRAAQLGAAWIMTDQPVAAREELHNITAD